MWMQRLLQMPYIRCLTLVVSWLLFRQTSSHRRNYPRTHNAIYRRHLKATLKSAFSTITTLTFYATKARAKNVDTESNFIFCTGFLLSQDCYASWKSLMTSAFPTSTITFIEDNSSIQTPFTLQQSSAKILQLTNTLKNVILLGHSRGGAVAALVALSSHENVKGVVLLDPVDDNMNTVITTIINQSNRSSSSSSFSNNRCRWLFVSTPYGGYSSYYGTKFTSACAPIGRDAEAIYNTLQNKSNMNAELLAYEDLGHFQLLNEEAIPASVRSMCAVNNKLDTKRLEDIRQDAFRQVVSFLSNL
jgi:hypothetical protein